MTRQDFSLSPYSISPSPPSLSVTGAIERTGDRIHVGYEIRGDLGGVAIPVKAERPMRRDGIWKETCCELFLARECEDSYWEFNLSPSGDWNVYRFAAYRHEMREEIRVTRLRMNVAREPGVFRLSLETDVAPILGSGEPLVVGMSVITRGTGGGSDYWALGHPGAQPDFHHRDSFSIHV